MKKSVHLVILLVSGLFFFTSCEKDKKMPAPEASQETIRSVTIGTGEVTGLSYVTGRSIAKIAGRKLEQQGFHLRVNPTTGPVFSLNAVRAGDFEFAVVRSDKLYQAIRGFGPWKNQGAQIDLLAVFTVHPESINLIAADDTGIKTVRDLIGKRVNIGRPGSDERKSSIHILENAGLDLETDLQAEEAETANAPGMLQDGRIDAFFYTTAHPHDTIRTATIGKRKVHFVPITSVRKLLLRSPYYVQTRIPVKLYPEATNLEDVKTIGYKISLVASSKAPNNLVYAILEDVFDNIENLRELHPVYQSLTKEDMTEGMYRMIHRSALYYYMRNGFRLSCCF